MSKAFRPPHRNPKTKELLQNKEQVCPVCFENFGTTEAGDLHRFQFVCLPPANQGLIATPNEFGTWVWRVPND